MSRVAIVTGAARGIGAATVDALVNDDYRVIAVARCRDIPEVPYALATSSDLDAVVARHGESVLGLVGDVRSDSDMQLAVETATRHFGRLDAVVACAGVVAGGAPIWELTDAAWDAVWSVTCAAPRTCNLRSRPRRVISADWTRWSPARAWSRAARRFGS